MNTKVDWTKVPQGTIIHVRDYDCEEWVVREFIYYDKNVICRNGSGNDYSHVTWNQAELIENVDSVVDIMNLVYNYTDSIGKPHSVSMATEDNLITALRKLVEPNNTTKLKPQITFEGNHVNIPYETTQKFLQITVAQHDLIKKLYPENKVSIIKWLRAEHKQYDVFLSLKESKDICDTICGLN